MENAAGNPCSVPSAPASGVSMSWLTLYAGCAMITVEEGSVLALAYDKALRIATQHPLPIVQNGDALIRVHLAGICNTDVEITRGYADFHGILGHEFVGVVEDAPDSKLIGRRVVGEINVACGVCTYCLAGLPTHCANRSVLGIHARDGAFAEYVVLPPRNLHVVPDSIPDDEAVFTEPLAAALQILEQVHIHPTDSVIVLGDGKLGSLVAQVVRLVGCDLVAVGKHEEKLAKLAALGIATAQADDVSGRRADIVIECTGQPSGLDLARALVHPRGVIVLKSTFHGTPPLALSPYVVDEVTIVGSRCGPFAAALRLLENRLVQVEPLISGVYPLAEGVQAMARATEPGILKILLQV